jgi:hypothetical protein
MTLPDRGADGGGEVAWAEAAAAAAAAAAAEVMERGVAVEVGWLGWVAWVVCLFGCWVEAPAAAALEREEGFWRKAAKKVERKKGRCEGMLGVIALVAAFSGMGLVWRVVIVSLVRSRGRAGGDIDLIPPEA